MFCSKWPGIGQIGLGSIRGLGLNKGSFREGSEELRFLASISVQKLGFEYTGSDCLRDAQSLAISDLC